MKKRKLNHLSPGGGVSLSAALFTLITNFRNWLYFFVQASCCGRCLPFVKIETYHDQMNRHVLNCGPRIP